MANLALITWPNKVTGNTFSGAEETEIKTVVNAAVNRINQRSLSYATYSDMAAALGNIGITSDIYQICVIADEHNNNGNLTNYTYTNGILNWIATTPIAI